MSNERSAEGFLIGKALEAEARAANAANETDRATWQDIAKDYRRLAEANSAANQKKSCR